MSLNLSNKLDPDFDPGPDFDDNIEKNIKRVISLVK